MLKFINFVAGTMWLFAAIAVLVGYLELEPVISAAACFLSALGFFSYALL